MSENNCHLYNTSSSWCFGRLYAIFCHGHVFLVQIGYTQQLGIVEEFLQISPPDAPRNPKHKTVNRNGKVLDSIHHLHEVNMNYVNPHRFSEVILDSHPTIFIFFIFMLKHFTSFLHEIPTLLQGALKIWQRILAVLTQVTSVIGSGFSVVLLGLDSKKFPKTPWGRYWLEVKKGPFMYSTNHNLYLDILSIVPIASCDFFWKIILVGIQF